MELAKYTTTIFASMLKFVGGPLAGLALQLTWLETAVCSVIGMMATVSGIMFLGEFISRIREKYFKKNSKPTKKFTKIRRFAVRIRSRFGLKGIAFLTPVFFSPPGGTLLAISFKYSKSEILFQMLMSAIGWGIVQTLFFYYVKDLIF